jgi:hypothetical protein
MFFRLRSMAPIGMPASSSAAQTEGSALNCVGMASCGSVLPNRSIRPTISRGDPARWARSNALMACGYENSSSGVPRPHAQS